MSCFSHGFLHHLTRWVLYHEIRIACRLGFGALGGVRVAGEERVPRRGGLIVAANHLSLADPVVLQTYVPRFLTYLMTDKFYYVPVLHQFVRFWGVLVVKQDGGNKESLRAAEEVLARGGAVGIFPEGGIARGGAAREVQGGVALLARRARVPILPVGLAGTERLLPPGALCLRRAPLSVYIGEPIPPGSEDRASLAAAVAQALRSCAAHARELLWTSAKAMCVTRSPRSSGTAALGCVLPYPPTCHRRGRLCHTVPAHIAFALENILRS